MEKLYFLFLLIFVQINSQIKENPILLIDGKNPFVLSTNDNDDYYYVMTHKKYLKINKDTGMLESVMDSILDESEYYFYISDNLYQNYLFHSERYFEIIFNNGISFISLQEISFHSLQVNDQSKMIKVGGIVKNDDLIIYGFSNLRGDIFFASMSRENYASIYRDNLNDKLSCKFIEEESFICAINFDSYLHLCCFKYHINEGDSEDDSLSIYENSLHFYQNFVTHFGLYDTDNNNFKLLCCNLDNYIQRSIFEPTIIAQNNVEHEFMEENLYFYTSEAFSEKNCYFIPFNSEYLFCCAVLNYIECYKIDPETKLSNDGFNISVPGDNSHLTIKTSDEYVAFFFMNNFNDINQIYEYYIYIPECQDREYIIVDSLNENKSENELEKIGNLINIKTNSYYFQLKNQDDEFGYFTLNGNRVTGRMLISNNDYILDFIVTKNDKESQYMKIFQYTVSVEEQEAYSKECQISITFKPCYHSCIKCSKEKSESNDDQHNCIKCKDSYYFHPENTNNCYPLEDKQLNWYIDTTNSKFGICHTSCRSCSGPTEFDCSTCYESLYSVNNCKLNCPQGYFPGLVLNDSENYYECKKCYKNCNTCSKEGNANEMNCNTCKDFQIKHEKNCYDIENQFLKTFYYPDINGNKITNCFEKFQILKKIHMNAFLYLMKKKDILYQILKLVFFQNVMIIAITVHMGQLKMKMEFL